MGSSDKDGNRANDSNSNGNEDGDVEDSRVEKTQAGRLLVYESLEGLIIRQKDTYRLIRVRLEGGGKCLGVILE
ncbi:hypothetical protein DL771_005900 [Monosporascus sp. 5C6A]|nr:hypothetical protein DL771_005900 [Monosporascus sp. 5C6A]